MKSFLTRLSNVIFWIAIALTAFCLGGVAYGVAERYFGHGELNDTALTFGAFAIPLLTAFWVITQYLITGKIDLINKKIVTGLMIAAAVIGGGMGVDNGFRIKKREAAAQEKALSEKKAQQEFELKSFAEATAACKDKRDMFESARKDQDYTMAEDLYKIYDKCMIAHRWDVGDFNRELFETGKQYWSPIMLPPGASVPWGRIKK